ncbi:MAG: peroxidase family protein [Micropepsaceae bacterium]
MAVTFTKNDLQYLLTQIQMAETNTPPVSPHLAFGLREVAGTNNNSVPGQSTFGSADQPFATYTQEYFRTVNVDETIFDAHRGVAGDFMTYASTAPGAIMGVNVVDGAPRTISNLISDISANNPAALQAAQDFAAQLGDGYTDFSSNPSGLILPGADGVFGTADDAWGAGLDGIAGNVDDLWGADGISGNSDDLSPADKVNLFIGNVTPDAGLSAPFNSWMTFFGQFFDHGLDLITKGSQGTVFIPLAADDPLITLGPDGIAGTGDEITNPNLQFMALTRATNLTVSAGADGIIGTSDDIHENINTTSPFVDQNQTYSSHPSHQVFLREYILGIDGKLHTTGNLLQHAAGKDGVLGNADDNSGMATWSDVKANALKFGLVLEDKYVGNVPVLLSDAYGNFTPDAATGHVQISVKVGANIVAFVLDPSAPLTIAQIQTATGGTVQFTDHAFINDMAATASPFDNQTHVLLAQDGDTLAGNTPGAGTYDNELLDAHYIAGDGRVNENIALITVHEIFHSEHNRLVNQIKDMVRAELANGDSAFASEWVLAGTNLADGIQAGEWNGERIFQAAKFGTETQYQHLVFEEFARKVAPTIHLFGNNDIHLDPAITSEFANAVYRFGHSMLDENVPIFETNSDGTMVIGPDGQPVLTDVGLIQAFTNPLLFASLGTDGTQQIIQGATHQIGSEIDEFVTGALRNNLLGLPLDLAALNIARGRDTGVAPLNLVRAQIYDATNDATLKPYANWLEFGQFLKHEGSLINFIAAYGSHSSITSASTMLAKRAAALDLITMGSDPASASGDAQHQDAYNFMHSLGDWANNTRVVGGDAKLNTADDTWAGGSHINNALMNIDVGADLLPGTADDGVTHAAMWATGSVTGLDTIDLWIGGLAEKQNLFGGLLGSTFNFIFETQLEALQDADRLYYLPRIEGMDFGFQIENNSFADMIIANTGARHIPASIFLTPEYTIEAGSYFQKDINGDFLLDINGHRIATDSSTWLRNPVSGALLVEVLPDGTVHFIGDDNFFGNTMVLGGTAGDDRLLAGHADDDTVWGDAGNDWIDGGNGNDFLYGGTGNDTIVDNAGDDVIHGEEGDDWINGGQGDDLIFAGAGNDYVETGNATLGDEAQGGAGNDILIGGDSDDALIGNEGDDWLEGGAGGDGLVGDTGAPTGQVPLFAGNDVLDGGTFGDKMVGFSGDDIMLGEGGFDKFNGLLGFDWADFEKEQYGVSLDMERREFIPNQQQLAGDAVRDFFIETEAASGTKFDDFMQGTEDRGGAAGVMNELTNVDLIFNLNTFFAGGVAANFAPDTPIAAVTNPLGFNNGNILLGGDGSDMITGRGGNDIIDGDAWLHVDLVQHGVAGADIIREIRWDITDGDIDTAVYRDVFSNYSISFAPDAEGFYTITHNATVGIGGGVLISDGVDKVRNIERLQFADVTINIGDGPVNNALPGGSLIITDDDGNPATPVNAFVGTPLVAVSTVTDSDGIAPGSVHFQWQQQMVTAGGGLQWVNIPNTDSLTFNPTNAVLGNALRVVETFVDGKGFHETVNSAPTALLLPNLAVNTAPFVVQQQNPAGLPDTGARTGVPINLFLPITSTFGDNETASTNLIYTAKLASNGHVLDGTAGANGLTFTLVPDGLGGVSGANITGTVNVTGPISITVTATDVGTPGSPGTELGVTDTFIINVISNGGAPFFLSADPVDLTGALEDTLFDGVVLAAQDPTNDPLAYKLVPGSAVNGSVTLNNNGTFTFLPTQDFAGTASFKYYAFDGLLKSAEKTVNITVAPVDDGTAPAFLTGTAANGGSLSAFLGFDPDGDITSGSEQFQWLRDGVEISGAIGADYIVQQTDIGHTISVAITYEDGQGNINDGAPGHLSPAVTDEILIGDVSVTGVVGANAPQMQQLSTLQDPDGGILDELTTLVWETSTDNGLTWLPVPAPQISADTRFFNPAGTTGAAGRLVRVTSTYTDGNGDTNTVNGSAVHYIIDAASGNNITGTAAIDLIFGNGGNDSITAGLGDDFVLGGAGNDTFFASTGDGNDTYDGGTGTDTYNMASTAGNTNVDLTNTNDLTQGGTATSALTGADLLFRIENVTGSVDDNIIVGSSSNNTLRGNGGNDTLDGGTAGTDTLIGGLGNDTYIVRHNTGGTGLTTITEAAGAGSGTDTVQSFVTYTIGNNVENLTLMGTGNINGTGNNLANVLTGNTGNNTLAGDDGNDTFIAFVGDGNDTYNGGAGADTLDMSAATNAVTVQLNNVIGNLFFAVATGTDIGTDVLSAFLQQSTIETFIGGSGNDTFTGRTAGGANAVTFVGGGGIDTFIAGNSVETMTGGIDADIFQYLSSGGVGTGGGRSIITDFHHAEGDIIDLTSIDANTTVSGNQAFDFIGSAAFSDPTVGATLAAGQIRWQLFDSDGNGSLDSTLIQGNLNDNLSADFEILLRGYVQPAEPTLVSTDFHL